MPLPGLGSPSDRSAVIVHARLPRALEQLRRVSVVDAAAGLPAHLTMLYPFVAPERLTSQVRESIAGVAARHRPFDYRLADRAVWPDTVYVRVEPEAPFLRLQSDLARAFPDFPIYGTDATFEFVPHVTIAEGTGLARATDAHPAWASLPRAGRTEALEIIGLGGDGRWRLIWRVPLGRMAP
jgi:2'-5' RNA ligase